MELLVFGDAHIKPTETAVDYERLTIPDSVDAVITAGDVIHRVDSDSVAAGKRFLAELDASGVPTFCIPGNHDPLDSYTELLDGLDRTRLLHESFTWLPATDGRAVTLVGWGCEQTTFEPEIQTTSFPSLDPRRTAADRQYAADRAAQRVEDTAYEVLVEQSPDRPRSQFREVAARLDLDEASYPTFERHWARLCDNYDRLTRLFGAAPEPRLVVTHLPPYNTDLDVHHSRGTREIDLDGIHCGSLALKIALREHQPLAALSGHSHRQAYERQPTHLLSLDGQGIVRVEIDLATEGFSYRYLHR